VQPAIVPAVSERIADGPRAADRLRRGPANDFWTILAHDPPTLRRTWAQTKDVMAAGSRDPPVKESIYLAVSVTNDCDYCIHAHHAAAKSKGMNLSMYAEALAVTALANQNNRLANGYRMDVDERYRT
jgi:AhpD family alkylhydroperoxidase